MARVSLRLAENVPGDIYVDETCIDCDTCRRLAPDTFARSPRGLSFVHRQPRDEAERLRARMALVSCPTASIGTVEKSDVSAAIAAFPERIVGSVHDCGFAAESSFGATSYLVVREGGNVLVDSPRAARPLVRRIEQLGGLGWMFLTHRDDVADHRRWRARFGCERVLHRADLGRDTADIERPLEGQDPIRLAPDLLAIPVPGHTRGSCALLYRNVLFTGDHLWADEDDGRLSASRGVCWYSWPAQLRSLERLLDFDFEWVLPGHGRPFHAPSPAAMRVALLRAISVLKATAS